MPHCHHFSTLVYKWGACAGNLFPTTWATPKSDRTWDSHSHWILASKQSQHHRKGPFMACCENVLRCKRVQSHFGYEEGAVLAGMAWNRINKNEQGGRRERGKSSFCGWGPEDWDKRPSGRKTGGMKEGSWAWPFLPITLIHCHHPPSPFPSAMPAHTKSSLSSAPCLSLPLCGASECRTVWAAYKNGNKRFCYKVWDTQGDQYMTSLCLLTWLCSHDHNFGQSHSGQSWVHFFFLIHYSHIMIVIMCQQYYYWSMQNIL